MVEVWEQDGVNKLGRIQALSLTEDVNAGMHAIYETDAWVNAFRLVSRGALHPGLSQDELKDEAFSYIETYEAYDVRDTQLFSRTLLHALRFVDL
jgi:hypothetical protein